MSIPPVKIKEFIKGSQKVFKICRMENKLGVAFYASDPKTRYPWIYTRDFSCVIVGLSELGDFKTAERSCRFLLNIRSEDGQWFQKYDTEGQRKDVEKDQAIVQEDNTLLALWAILSYLKESNDENFKKENKTKIEKSLRWIEDYHQKNLEELGLVYSTTSIHQTPGFNQGYELWHNSLAAKVFLLAFEIYKNKRYQKINELIKKSIGERLVINGRFIRKLDDNKNPDFAPDMIMSSPAYFGIFNKKELIDGNLSYFEVLKNTLKFLEEKLSDKEMGGFFRYPNEVTKKWFPKDKWAISDPLVPGPYLVTTAFMIQLYYQLKEKDKADKMLGWLLSQGVGGELPEHLTSRERFSAYRENEWKYMLEKKKDKKYLEGVKNNFKRLEEEAERSDKLHYVLPLAWSQIEGLKCLKRGGYSDKFIL